MKTVSYGNIIITSDSFNRARRKCDVYVFYEIYTTHKKAVTSLSNEPLRVESKSVCS